MCTLLAIALLITSPPAAAQPSPIEGAEMNLAALSYWAKRKGDKPLTAKQRDVARDVFLAYGLRKEDRFNPTVIWATVPSPDPSLLNWVAQTLTLNSGLKFQFMLDQDIAP